MFAVGSKSIPIFGNVNLIVSCLPFISTILRVKISPNPILSFNIISSIILLKYLDNCSIITLANLLQLDNTAIQRKFQ